MPAELRVADHGAMRGTQTARGSLDGATWGLLALLAAAGCECSDSITAVKGSIATDPTALDFGSVPLGAEKRLSLSIRNRGSFTLTITGFEAAAPFVAPTASGTIGTAAPRVVEVGFRPTALGAAGGALRISSDDEDLPVLEVPLSGTGIEAAVTVEPSAIDFGEVLWTTQTMPESREITISNPGTDALDVTAIEVPEDAMGAFTVDVMGALTRYAPGASQRFRVTLAPKAMGPITGRIVVKTTARAAPEVPVTLAARIVGPVLAVCASKDGASELCTNQGMNPRVDLGLVPINTRATGKVRILNVGDRPMIATARVIDRPDAFAISPDLATLGELMLLPGGEQQLVVAYQADGYDFDTANLAIGANAAPRSSAVVRLDARVPQPDARVVPETFTFTLFGSGAMRGEGTVRLVNCGEIPLTLRAAPRLGAQTGPANAFSIVRGPAGGETIMPGDCTQTAPGLDVVVAFAASAAGSYAGTIELDTDDPDTATTVAQLRGDRRP
jgi:hypothetical protein